MGIEEARNISTVSALIGIVVGGIGFYFARAAITRWKPNSVHLYAMKFTLWPCVLFAFLVGQSIVAAITYLLLGLTPSPYNLSANPAGMLLGSVVWYFLLFAPLYFFGRYRHKRNLSKGKILGFSHPEKQSPDEPVAHDSSNDYQKLNDISRERK